LFYSLIIIINKYIKLIKPDKKSGFKIESTANLEFMYTAKAVYINGYQAKHKSTNTTRAYEISLLTLEVVIFKSLRYIMQ
jgi:hypothetical protein